MRSTGRALSRALCVILYCLYCILNEESNRITTTSTSKERPRTLTHDLYRIHNDSDTSLK